MAVAAMAEEVMMTAEVTIAAEVTHTQARRGPWDGRRVSKTARGIAPAAPACVACCAAVVAVVVAVLRLDQAARVPSVLTRRLVGGDGV